MSYNYQGKQYSVNTSESIQALQKYNQLKGSGKTVWLGLKVTKDSIELTTTEVGIWNRVERFFGSKKWNLEEATNFLNEAPIKADDNLKKEVESKISPSIEKWNGNRSSKNISTLFSKNMPITANENRVKCSEAQLKTILKGFTSGPVKDIEKSSNELLQHKAIVTIQEKDMVSVPTEVLFKHVQKTLNKNITEEFFNKTLQTKLKTLSEKPETTDSSTIPEPAKPASPLENTPIIVDEQLSKDSQKTLSKTIQTVFSDALNTSPEAAPILSSDTTIGDLPQSAEASGSKIENFEQKMKDLDTKYTALCSAASSLKGTQFGHRITTDDEPKLLEAQKKLQKFETAFQEKYPVDFSSNGRMWHGRLSLQRVLWQDEGFVKAIAEDPYFVQAIFMSQKDVTSGGNNSVAGLVLWGLASNRLSYLTSVTPNWVSMPQNIDQKFLYSLKVGVNEGGPNSNTMTPEYLENLTKGLDALEKVLTPLADAQHQEKIVPIVEQSNNASAAELVQTFSECISSDKKLNQLVYVDGNPSTKPHNMALQCYEGMSYFNELLEQHRGDESAVLDYGLISHVLDARHLASAMYMQKHPESSHMKEMEKTFEGSDLPDGYKNRIEEGQKCLNKLLEGIENNTLSPTLTCLLKIRLQQVMPLIHESRLDQNLPEPEKTQAEIAVEMLRVNQKDGEAILKTLKSSLEDEPVQLQILELSQKIAKNPSDLLKTVEMITSIPENKRERFVEIVENCPDMTIEDKLVSLKNFTNSTSADLDLIEQSKPLFPNGIRTPGEFNISKDLGEISPYERESVIQQASKILHIYPELTIDDKINLLNTLQNTPQDNRTMNEDLIALAKPILPKGIQNPNDFHILNSIMLTPTEERIGLIKQMSKFLDAYPELSSYDKTLLLDTIKTIPLNNRDTLVAETITFLKKFTPKTYPKDTGYVILEVINGIPQEERKTLFELAKKIVSAVDTAKTQSPRILQSIAKAPEDKRQMLADRFLDSIKDKQINGSRVIPTLNTIRKDLLKTPQEK